MKYVDTKIVFQELPNENYFGNKYKWLPMRLHRVPLFLSVTGYRRIINKRSTSTIDTQK